MIVMRKCCVLSGIEGHAGRTGQHNRGFTSSQSGVAYPPMYPPPQEMLPELPSYDEAKNMPQHGNNWIPGQPMTSAAVRLPPQALNPPAYASLSEESSITTVEPNRRR